MATDQLVATLAEALAGADVFLGLSAADTLSPELLHMMATDPIGFALANPNPEIAYELALATHPDGVMAPGQPSQQRAGLPCIFRGALDVRATEINEAMKLAAVHALAQLVQEPVPA